MADIVFYSPEIQYGRDESSPIDRVWDAGSSPRYVFIDPFSDRGFKHLFSKPESKAALISLLNSVLEGREAPIVDIEYVNTEQIPVFADGRKTVFDIYWHEEPSDREVETIKKQLVNWNNLNEFDKRAFKIFRNVLKYGDQVFVRDPETFEWYW
ncbi:MAG: portal protein, partial [Balneolaceae bacterium]